VVEAALIEALPALVAADLDGCLHHPADDEKPPEHPPLQLVARAAGGPP
jgi:hypothetical protein